MTSDLLLEKAEAYLRRLCLEIPNRGVGSEGNRATTGFFASVVASFGFATESPEFDCIDWRNDGVSLRVDGAPFEAFASPYSQGCNVIARKGADPTRRVVLFAHIDAKLGTPGATDNASGITALLLLAQLLADYAGNLGVEIVALNGEDYYSNPGELQYLNNYADRFAEIVLGINLDGVGYYRGKTAYSLYDCPPVVASTIHKVFSSHENMVEGEPWYQGDHGLFLMNQRPALAITSERAMELLTEVAHTPKDRPDIVDATKLVKLSLGLRDLVLALDGLPT